MRFIGNRPGYFASLILILAAAVHAQEGPSIHSNSFHMSYGLAGAPITARDYVYDIWYLRAALKETNLPGKTAGEAEKLLKKASEELVPLWRQSEQNPKGAGDVNAKAAVVWAAFEGDFNRILGPAVEQFKDRMVIVFLQELIVPCPDTVWGSPDFMHLNLSERQKKEIDDAFSKADDRADKALEEFRAAIEKDPGKISADAVEKLRELHAERRHQVRSRMSAEQLGKFDNYILSEAKKWGAEEAGRVGGEPKPE